MQALDTVVEIFPLLGAADAAPPQYLDDVANTKRFLEVWVGHAEFRARLPQDPRGIAREWGLEADAEALRPLWDLDPAAQTPAPSPSVRRYRAFIQEKIAWRGNLRAQARSQNPVFDAWRLRQINRCYSQLGLQKADGIVHASAAFELCRGCSVGCWFCGIGARKLTEVWPYDEANAALWRGTLGALREVVGDSAARGFCYWATDPLDNPQYEDFCTDFSDMLGLFPQTTTAQPMREPARMRRLLALSRGRGCEINRFSILSKSVLKKVMEEYTARELLFVELVMQMDGSWDGKAFAGKARDREQKFETATAHPIPDESQASTIACVSGFLVRMPAHTIELVSPCNASARWPLGYRVHERRTFDSAQTLRAQLEDMVGKLSTSIRGEDVLALRPDLRLELTDDGFTLASAWLKHTFNRSRYPAMRAVGEALLQGRTAGETALDIQRTHGIALHDSFFILNKLYAAGFLDDEPGLTQEAADA